MLNQSIGFEPGQRLPKLRWIYRGIVAPSRQLDDLDRDRVRLLTIREKPMLVACNHYIPEAHNFDGEVL